MSGILGNAVTGAGGGTYTVDNSLRLRSSAGAFLNKTVSVSGSSTTWTWSAWIKLGTLPTAENGLFGAGGGASPGPAPGNSGASSWLLFLRSSSPPS